MDRRQYPPEWPAIVAAIARRAGGRCECTGWCGCNDHPGGCGARQGEAHPVTGSIVVLTTAHLWRGACAAHHAAGIKCGELNHLAHLCQRCHLAYDLEHHIANRRRNARARRASGDLFGA